MEIRENSVKMNRRVTQIFQLNFSDLFTRKMSLHIKSLCKHLNKISSKKLYSIWTTLILREIFGENVSFQSVENELICFKYNEKFIALNII